MTIEDLKQYKYLKLEKQQLQGEIADMYATLVQSPEMPGMPSGGAMGDMTGRSGIRAAELRRQLEDKCNEIAALHQKIEMAIGELPLMERVIMRERYIKGHGWRVVAEEVGYSERQVFYIHKRALEKLADHCSP